MTDRYGEYTVLLKDLPPSVRGFVFHTDDGDPVMILNSRLTREANRGSYDHELLHIQRGDMDNPNFIEYGEETPA